MGPIRMLRCFSPSLRFNTLGISRSWSGPPCCVPVSSGDPTASNTLSSFSGSSSLYTSTVQPGPSGLPVLTQRSRPTIVFKSPTLLPPTSYLLPLYPSYPFILLAVFIYLLFSFPFLTLSGFFNRMLEVFKPQALNYYTIFRLILLILSINGIQSQLVFLFPDPWILCSAI